jgi:two-component sensor histidine kinase
MANSEPSLMLDALQARLADMLSDPAESFPSLAEAARRVRMLEATLETVPVGVIVAEVPSGRIILANREMEKLTGHPVIYSGSIEDYDGWVAYHADGSLVEVDQWPLSRVIRDNLDSATMDFDYQRGDGTRRWMRAYARPVHDGSGVMIGATVAMIDIDEEKRRGDVQQVLIGELNHRAKNMLGVIKSIVGQTLRRENVDSAIIEKMSDRLDAYARAHTQMTSLAGNGAEVADIARQTLGVAIDEGRVSISGPSCQLPERTALALSMAFHELATNATKHGALSVAKGNVTLEWTIQQDGKTPKLSMIWQELGGPTPIAPESEAQKGFGSIVIDRALTMQARGKVQIDYPPQGMRWIFTAPLI